MKQSKKDSLSALEGIRVIDLGWVWSGPMASQFLADMGAEVIKIEHYGRLDSSRFRGKIIKDIKKDVEVSPYFHELNRNKLSINLNLRKPEGVRLFKKLAAVSDVIIQNFSFGVVEKLGVDYETIRQVKPEIIYVAMPTAGLSGPLKDIIGYAPVYTSLGGIESLVGYEDGTVTGMIMIGPGDPNAAIHGALAALAAIYNLKKTGEGQLIEVSQIESITHLLGEAVMEYSMNNRVMGPRGNRHPSMAPHGIYPCQGEDQWVSIAVKTDDEWETFCTIMGKPQLATDVRFSCRFERLRRQDALDEVVSEWSKKHSKYEITQLLQSKGIAAAPVLNREERFSEQHLIDRENFLKVSHPVYGEEVLGANTWRLSLTPPRIYRHAPLVGEHNDYVYKELLEMSEAEIKKLQEEKVLY
jgi:benzylsuccinate CoA-transferase BbsF subunit